MTERQRRHRGITAPSGIVLFACLFLPTWRPCANSEPLPFAIVPFAWPPFIAALLIGLVALAPDRAATIARGVLLLAQVRVTAIALAVFASVALVDDGFSLSAAIAVKVGTVLALLVPWRGTERAIAGTALAVSIGVLALAVLLVLDPLSAWGAWVMLVAASGLALGCIVWCVEVQYELGTVDPSANRTERDAMHELCNRSDDDVLR